MSLALNASEQVFELRFTPSPLILDHRGTWAEEFSLHMELPRWEIADNRLDLFSEDRKERAFISFRNAGFISFDAASPHRHKERSQRFTTFLLSRQGFSNPLRVERIGVRGKYCIEFGGSFDELLHNVVTRYIAPSPQLLSAFGADTEITDIGAPLNFKDPVGRFNTGCGPMGREQLRTFFGHRSADSLPLVGLYADIDYWEKTGALRIGKDLSHTIGAFADATGRRLQQIRSTVLGSE